MNLDDSLLGKSIGFSGNSVTFKSHVISYIIKHYVNNGYKCGFDMFINNNFIFVSNTIKNSKRGIIIRPDENADIMINLSDYKVFSSFYKNITGHDCSHKNIESGVDLLYYKNMFPEVKYFNYSDSVNKVISFVYEPTIDRFNNATENISIEMFENIISKLLKEEYDFSMWDTSKQLISTKEYLSSLLKISSWIISSKSYDSIKLNIRLNEEN